MKCWSRGRARVRSDHHVRRARSLALRRHHDVGEFSDDPSLVHPDLMSNLSTCHEHYARFFVLDACRAHL
jgi:hypothetical protein